VGDKKYFLAIVNDGKNIYGHLSGEGFHDDTNRFCPFTVLCDLMDMVLDYESVSPEERVIKNYSYKDTYQLHPFFQDESIRRKVDIYRNRPDRSVPFMHEHTSLIVELNSFIVAVIRLHECFLSGKSISLNELELIKALNQFRFTFEVGERSAMDKSKYMPVFFGTGVTAQIWQEHLEEAENTIRFAYTCYSLEEALFAVWHYLILNDYTKFHKCPHCDRYFATKSLRGYCKRNSPYKGYGYLKNSYKEYSGLNCKLAVDRIKEQMTRRRGKVCEHIQTHYGFKVLHEFANKYDDLKGDIIKCPSVENLKKLDLFLAIDEVQKTWYKPEYKEY